MSDELTVGFIIADVWCAIGVILGLLLGPHLRRRQPGPVDPVVAAHWRDVEERRARALRAQGRERLARAGSCDTDALPRRSPLHIDPAHKHPRTLTFPTDRTSA